MNHKSPAELDEANKKFFTALPAVIQKQLQQDRDQHGNITLSHIEIDLLLIDMVKKRVGDIAFNPVRHFFGYEGRSATPSLFDSHYCYSLGMTAALLIEGHYSGYMAVISNLKDDIAKWIPKAVPLASMIHLEMRNGEEKPVIKKALVDIDGKLFKIFDEKRLKMRTEDSYSTTGPMQFFGPDKLIYSRPLHLTL